MHFRYYLQRLNSVPERPSVPLAFGKLMHSCVASLGLLLRDRVNRTGECLTVEEAVAHLRSAFAAEWDPHMRHLQNRHFATLLRLRNESDSILQVR